MSANNIMSFWQFSFCIIALVITDLYVCLQAQCFYAGPGNVSCVCNDGWTGDGIVCVEINNCLMENRGGCHENAYCTFTGPGQVIPGNIFWQFLLLNYYMALLNNLF